MSQYTDDHDGHDGHDGAVSAAEVAEQVRDTLASSEMGRRRGAVALIAEAADSNQRAAQNWLDGRNGPSLANFINLCRHIPELKQLALRMIHANDAIDPLFEANMTEAAQRWLDWHTRKRGE